MKKILAVTLAASLLVGCETMGDKETAGAILGTAGGALLGAQFGGGKGNAVMTAAGAVGGLLLGQSLGRSLDDVDRLKQREAAATAFETYPTGRTAEWQNPDTGHYGAVTPTRTFEKDAGEYCREFTQTVNVSGKKEEAYGTACRQPDGTWKIAS